MSTSLFVIEPVTITGALLVSSTVAENDYPAWTAGATFGVGDRCISPVTHRIYESQIAANQGFDPTVLTNQFGPVVRWLDVDPTSRWAMFDGEASTQTVGASPMTIVLRPGGFNSLYLCGLDADVIHVVVRDAPGGEVIYEIEEELEASAPADYFEWCWDRFKPKTDFLAMDIDQYNNAEVTVTLIRTGGGTVKCGVLALGDLRPVGTTLKGAKAKPKSYSYIDTDKYGKTTIKRRKATTDISLTAVIEKSEADGVLRILQGLLDVPCVWIGSPSEGFEGLRGFGLGSGEVTYDDLCTLNFTMQGLT